MVKIRRYQAQDKDSVIHLFRQFMADLTLSDQSSIFQSYVQRAIDEELNHIDKYYLRRKGNEFLVAEESHVIGMVGIEKHSKSIAELRRMVVDHLSRRRGVGRYLLARAEEHCGRFGYRQIILNTSELQQPAMRFYEANGYTLTRTESASIQTHKNVGIGLKQYYYTKYL